MAPGGKHAEVAGGKQAGEETDGFPAFRRSTLYRGLERWNAAFSLRDLSSFPFLIRVGKVEWWLGPLMPGHQPCLRRCTLREVFPAKA